MSSVNTNNEYKTNVSNVVYEPLGIITVNLQKSFFSSIPPTYINGEGVEKCSQFWVGQKSSAKLLGVKDGTTSPMKQFLRWATKTYSGEKHIFRMYHPVNNEENTGDQDNAEHLCNVDLSSSTSVQTFIKMDLKSSGKIPRALLDSILAWRKTLISSGTISSTSWPRICIVGGWTDLHVYHTCYEVRNLVGNHKDNIATCSILSASPRDDNHWASITRLKQALGVKICSSVVDLIQWCQGGEKLSKEEASSLVNIPDQSNRPKMKWITELPEAFEYEIDSEILALLYRGTFCIRLSAIHGGLSGGVVIYVDEIAHGGHKLKPTVVKLDKRGVIVGEYEAFCKVEDMLGNNAPSVRGFVELGDRAGVKFRCTGMSNGANSTLHDRILNGLPISHAIDEIFEQIFDCWYSSRKLDRFNLYTYYTQGFASTSSDRKSPITLCGKQLKQIAAFLSKAQGDDVGQYYRQEPRMFGSGIINSPSVVFDGLPAAPNIGYLYDDQVNGISIVEKMPAQTFMSTFSHGDANTKNFIVDAKQNVWVIDFALSNPDNHILRDAIRFLSSVIYGTVPIESKTQLFEMYSICKVLIDSESLGSVLPDIDAFNFSNHRSIYTYSQLILPLWHHMSRVVYDPDRVEQTNIYQFHVAFFAESVRYLKYRTPTLFNKQLAFVVAGMAAAAAIETARRSVFVVADEIESSELLKSLHAGTIATSFFPRMILNTDKEQTIRGYILSLKKTNVTHIVVDAQSVVSKSTISSSGWPLDTIEIMKSVALEIGITVLKVPNHGAFQNGFSEAIDFISNILFILSLNRDSRAVKCCFAKFWNANTQFITLMLGCTLVATGYKIDECIKIGKKFGGSGSLLYKTTLQEFSINYQQTLIKSLVKDSHSKINFVNKSSVSKMQSADFAVDSDFTPRRILEIKDGVECNESKTLGETLLQQNYVTRAAVLPLTVPTVPAESIYVKSHQVSNYGDECQFDKGRKKLAFLQDLALKKATISNGMDLDEYLKSSSAFFGNQPMTQPIDLGFDEEVTKKKILEFVSKALMITESEILFEHVVGGGAKGNTGDAVAFITDRNPNRNVLAVMKLFERVSTFERELAAIARASKWFEDSNFITTPRAISAEFVVKQGGSTGGVLIMTAAKGAPLDDIMLNVSKSRGSHRQRLIDSLKDVLALSTKALFIFHTKLVTQNPNTSIVLKTVNQCIDIVEKIYIALEDSQQENKSNEENMVKELLGTKKATLSQLQHIATMAKSNPGLGCVNHGDAHLGNIFVSSEFSRTVTFIDLESINYSVGPNGEPIGCAAADVSNFIHKIGQNGRNWGFTDEEISMLQNEALKSYSDNKFDLKTATGEAVQTEDLLTYEMFDLFLSRRQLGEIHRRLCRENNLPLAIRPIVALKTTFNRANTRYKDEFTEADDVENAIYGSEKDFEGEKKLGDIDLNFATDGFSFAGHEDDSDQEDDEDDASDSSQESADENEFIPSPNLAKKAQRVFEQAADRFKLQENERNKSMTKDVGRWLNKINKQKSIPTQRRLGSIPQDKPVFFVFGELDTENYKMSHHTQKMLKRLVGVISGLRVHDRNERNIHYTASVVLIGGRPPGRNVSIAREMKRWLQDFQLNLKYVIEELSLCVTEQVIFALSLLRSRKYRSGTITVICSQKNMPFISQACSILKKTKCERSKGYTFNYLSVVNEKKYQNMKNSFEKDSVEVEEVRTFIKRFKCKGKNSRKWPYGDSVSLLWAARAGALLQIKNFVAASITNSIDEMRDSIGRSALHLASFAGHYDCVFFLLKLGADPNLKDNNNSTPLHYAVAGGIVSVVQLLVQHGASLKIFGSCCEDAGDVLAILYSGGEGQIRWNGALRPYDIVRRRINSLNRVSQSQQPLWTAIMFLVHPCTPTGMICSNKRNQRIFCFRHAESLWNAQGSNRLKGLIDAPLTIRGYHQCANLKQYLQQSSALTRLNIQLVVVSPLTRALETYKEVFRWYVDEMGEQAKVIIDPRISEKVSSSGSKGTPTSVLKEKYPNFQFENLSENWWYHPSALSSSKSRWEPEKNVVTRVRSFLKWISCRPESNILIIGHGHTFRTLTNFAYNKVSMEEDENYDLEVMSYEGVNELNIQENFSDAAPDQMFRCNLDMVSVGISTKI